MLWLLLPALALVALLLPFGAVAGPPPCQTKNVRTGFEYKGATPLSTAITEANTGDTINVWGTCVGNFEVGKNLTLKGQGKNATLDGNQQGRVLTINGGTTTIQGLRITNGQMPNGQTPSAGGGIYVATAAVLVNVLVTGNAAGTNDFGGGIEADLGSSLTLVNSTVSGNAAGSSGGIDMFRAKATLINSTVTGNHATRAPGPDTDSGCLFGTVIYACAGGIWNYQGTLALVDTTVSGNTTAYRGGGVVSYVRFFADGTTPRSGLTILSGATSISSNTASNSGGGIFVNNPIATSGFGVQAADGTATYKDPISGATLPAWTGSVSGNTPDQCSPTLTIGSTTCGA
jgi:hypothetical protein